MKQNETPAARKLFRDNDKKAALSEAEKLRRETLKKTAKLRALRLEKEATERAEQPDKPSKTTGKRSQ